MRECASTRKSPAVPRATRRPLRRARRTVRDHPDSKPRLRRQADRPRLKYGAGRRGRPVAVRRAATGRGRVNGCGRRDHAPMPCVPLLRCDNVYCESAFPSGSGSPPRFSASPWSSCTSRDRGEGQARACLFGRARRERAWRIAVEAIDLVGEDHPTWSWRGCGPLYEADEIPARAVLDKRPRQQGDHLVALDIGEAGRPSGRCSNRDDCACHAAGPTPIPAITNVVLRGRRSSRSRWRDGSPFVGLLRVEAADARATPNVGPSLA